MNISNKQFPSIEQMAVGLKSNQNIRVNAEQKTQQFSDILKQKQMSKDLKFSKHANERLDKREIVLTDSQMKRLETGTAKALEKGIKESLVLVDDLAFIVNVQNKVVVTAVNDGDDKTFTNIDGAVII